jgi:hypothetical protein
MWRSVDLVWTDVSEERISSIFRVEKSASEEPAWAGGCSHRRENLKSYKLGNVDQQMACWSVRSVLLNWLENGTT